ncbi:MAG: methyl-accepting chemotaxis protein [Candidatus Eisenbacteria bacterium]
MKGFLDLPMRAKLMTGFGAVSVLAAVMCITGVLAVGSLQKHMDAVFQRHAIGLAHLKEGAWNTLAAANEVRSAILAPGGEAARAFEAEFRGHDEKSRAEFEQYIARIQQPKNKEKAARLMDHYREAFAHWERALELAVQDRDFEAVEELAKADEPYAAYETLRLELDSEKMENLGKAGAKAIALSNSGRTRLLVVGVLIVALSIFFGMRLSGMVTRPLADLVRCVDRASKGDLSVRAKLAQRDELGRLGAAFDRMIGEFDRQIAGVRMAADRTAEAARELSSGSAALSEGAQTQASALEETAASLTQMSESVRGNSEHASQADQRATGTRAGAESGGETVRRAVDSMQRLSESSRRISEISATIDEIAFQTNLLALNASVEAARAGEQGRGFAVVAAEVRALALRSANASHEIKDLINDSVARVEDSTKLVDLAGDNLQRIVGDIRAVATLVGEISAATREQSQGIDQVHKAVEQMDRITQGYAAQAEELTSTARNLAESADSLQHQMAHFQLSGTAG